MTLTDDQNPNPVAWFMTAKRFLKTIEANPIYRHDLIADAQAEATGGRVVVDMGNDLRIVRWRSSAASCAA